MGSTGPAVTALQQQLNSKGEKVAVNGTFGPRTQEAVRRVQLTNGIQPANGVVGPATASSLASTARRTDGFDAAPAKRPMVSLGVPQAPAAFSATPTVSLSSLQASSRAAPLPPLTTTLRSGATRFFDTAPLPQNQPLKTGEATGYHAIRETPDGRRLLDTSDAVRVPASADKLKQMVESGNWTQAWWGGSSQTEANPSKPGEVSNFDFIPEKKGPVALAQLNVSIKTGETSVLPDGRTMTTYEAKLNPRGANAGDKRGAIQETGDVSGDMRIHIVDNKDGTSTFQLDWKGMVIEPKPGIPGGALIDAAFNPSYVSGGLGVADKLGRGLINIVGEGHNNALRPPKDAKTPSGFLQMFNELGQGDEYKGSVDFKVAHPEIKTKG